MKLAALIQHLPISVLRGDTTVEIAAVTDDSREVGPGAMFIARPGNVVDGGGFIDDAIHNGAAAILADSADELPDSVAQLTAPDVTRAGAMLAERFHGHPSQALKLIGITGTNGKTTTAHLIQQMLNSIGMKTGLIGTIHIDDGATTTPAALTTPGAVQISEILSRMVAHGCQACVMECSSHALAQQRTAGLSFDAGIFTNLSGDHLDYHKTMDEYAAAKARLFEALPKEACAIINTDDDAAAQMISRTSARPITAAMDRSDADARAVVHLATITGSDTTFSGGWGAFNVQLPLIGRHNAANALLAVTMGHELGADSAVLARTASNCVAPPGRLERVTSLRHPYQVFVDYAHTDDALDTMLGSVRPLVPKGGRLRVVFGCGGDRDRSKRPRMAAAAWRWADQVFVTSDNPRTEDPQAIVDEVLSGVPRLCRPRTLSQVDRAEAIELAIRSARQRDVVIIAGKGHEDYQIIGTTRRAFDDREVAQAALLRDQVTLG